MSERERLTETGHEDLGQRIATLRASFAALGACAAEAADALTATIAPPLPLLEALTGSRQAFDELRSAVVDQALTLALVLDAESLHSLGDLEPVLEAIAEAERRRAGLAAWQEVREASLAVLDRVMALIHREDRPLPVLQECRAQARELHAFFSGPPPDDLEHETTMAGARVQPFSDLLALVDGWNVLDDERCASLQDAITQSFSRPLALAALRGKIGRAGETPPPAPERPAARATPPAAPPAAEPAYAPAPAAPAAPAPLVPEPVAAPAAAPPAPPVAPPPVPVAPPPEPIAPPVAPVAPPPEPVAAPPPVAPPPAPVAPAPAPVPPASAAPAAVAPPVPLLAPPPDAAGTPGVAVPPAGAPAAGSGAAGATQHGVAPPGAPLAVEVRLSADKVSVETPEARKEREQLLERLAAESAQWWIKARAGWMALRDRGIPFKEAVREQIERFPYLLAVPLPKTTEYEGGRLAEGYALLLQHIEKQEEGFVAGALTRLNPQFTTRAKDESYPLGQELYLYVVAEGRLYKTYPDFLREVLVTAVPSPGPWVQGGLIESDGQTVLFTRPADAPGASQRETKTITNFRERLGPHVFTVTTGPLTTRFFTLETAESAEPCDLEVKLTENDAPSDRAWLVTLPAPGGKPQPAAPRRHKVNGTTLAEMGKEFGGLWVAVFNADPNTEKRYELSFTFRRKPPAILPPGAKAAAGAPGKSAFFGAKTR